jgi:LPXTG-motif cell wall-anchored protein
MSTTIRFFRRASIAAAGLVGITVVSSTAADAAVPDEPRSVLFIGVDACPDATGGGGAISVGYDDLVDGHRPVGVIERLADQSGELWSSTEVRQVNGDYFNVHNFPATAVIPITGVSVFTYSLSITYDDGVTQTQAVSLSVADVCGSGSPTTTVPPTTAPPTTAPAERRFDFGWDGFCLPDSGGSAIWYDYLDANDGHVPVEYHFQLLAGDAVVYNQSGPHGLPSEDWQGARWEIPGDFGVDRVEATTYTLVLWVKYDDGVVVSARAPFEVRGDCQGDDPATTPPSSSPTTTTVPSGQLPQTGSSTTGPVVAVGALLSAAGAALVLGSRRRPAA